MAYCIVLGCVCVRYIIRLELQSCFLFVCPFHLCFVRGSCFGGVVKFALVCFDLREESFWGVWFLFVFVVFAVF